MATILPRYDIHFGGQKLHSSLAATSADDAVTRFLADNPAWPAYYAAIGYTNAVECLRAELVAALADRDAWRETAEAMADAVDGAE